MKLKKKISLNKINVISYTDLEISTLYGNKK